MKLYRLKYVPEKLYYLKGIENVQITHHSYYQNISNQFFLEIEGNDKQVYDIPDLDRIILNKNSMLLVDILKVNSFDFYKNLVFCSNNISNMEILTKRNNYCAFMLNNEEKIGLLKQILPNNKFIVSYKKENQIFNSEFSENELNFLIDKNEINIVYMKVIELERKKDELDKIVIVGIENENVIRKEINMNQIKITKEEGMNKLYNGVLYLTEMEFLNFLKKETYL